MKTKIRNGLSDIWIMFWRCMLNAIRNPETLVTSIAAPATLMFLFLYVFGGAMNVGDYDFTNFIVPGIILQCIGQGVVTTATSVNSDLKSGIINRFRTMPIAKSAVLSGHVLAATIRNLLIAFVIIGVALLIGFRPEANFFQWLGVIGILNLYILAVTWISVLVGLTVRSSESAISIMTIMSILPFFSSGFAPTETMPVALQTFANHQPMTPVIETLRALMLNGELGKNLQLTLIWWIAILVIAYLASIQAYKRKLTI